MSKSKNKILRYKNLFKKVDNWGQYLIFKILRYKNSFEFKIKTFGTINVPIEMLGPFREVFFDDIYFRHIPKEVISDKEDLTIIDIGANVGYFALSCFSKSKNLNTFSFEPHPYCFKKMKEYKGLFNNFNWVLENSAISHKKEQLILCTDQPNGFTTTSSVNELSNEYSTIAVEANTLEFYLIKYQIKEIDFLKMDCEGSEYDIFYKMSESCFKKIKTMCIETHLGSKENENIKDLNEFIKSKGFTTKILIENQQTGYIWAWKNIVILL